jgi:hypothetical protein
MVLVSFMQELLAQVFDKHKRLARINFPIWLYMSPAPGVVVYLMISIPIIPLKKYWVTSHFLGYSSLQSRRNVQCRAALGGILSTPAVVKLVLVHLMAIIMC